MSESKAEAQSVIIELNDLAQDADHFGNTGDARVAREAIDLIERQARIIEEAAQIIINRCDTNDPRVKYVVLRALAEMPEQDFIPE